MRFSSRVVISGLFLITLFVYASTAHVYLGPESVKYLVHSHKGEHNPHPGWFQGELDELGGPDAAGYIFRDSQEEDGPDYAWVEMSGTGTELTTLEDDDFAGPFELPWSFEFYGTEYDEIYICSNGYLAFGMGSDSYDNTTIPHAEFPNNIIAFFWDDLNPESGGTVYYGTDGEGRWICQFDEIREYGDSGTITAEVILDQSGTILLQYQSLASGIGITGETIGIENGSGTIGLMTSLDSSPQNYPFNSLAIEFSQMQPDASVSGTITDSDTNTPIEGAVVEFGSLSAVTDQDGVYSIDEIFAGDYPVHIYANGYFDFRAGSVVIEEGENTYNRALEPSGMPSGFVGYWTFDDPGDLTNASVGNDLVLSGSHEAIEGPGIGNGAITIGPGSFYRCNHDIEANGAYGNAEWVNQFTIVMDIRIPELDQWYCFYQTNWENSNDGDWFVDPDGQVGVGDTGYSEYVLIPGDWYRVAISVNLGVHYNYYLDGQLLQIGGEQAYDGRFALYPADDANQVLFFADNNSEDNAIDVAEIMLFDRSLTSAELASLDGYGHEFDGPEISYMDPFLQTPTPNSLYVCWHSSASTESLVEYGTTEELGMEETGECIQLSQEKIWHWVQLTGLDPETTYYYRVVSDTAQSTIRAFTTQQPDGDDHSHVRFTLHSDTQTSDGHRAVMEAMESTLIEQYGEDFHEDLQLAMLTGDIVNTGSNLGQYTSLFFNHIAAISDNLPAMNSIGNHEAEAELYYQYMKYEDFGGPEGERYYSFWIGNVLFIALNSNTQGQTQLNWLENLLETAQNDDDIDWIFVFQHHPGHSETWPDGNTSWTQNDVIPLLSQYSKVEQLCYGHTHAYERGATCDSNLRLLCFGGGGGHLDRWGMYDNQTDYPEIFRSHDYYGYTIFDIDSENDCYTATVYTLGNEDHPLDNVVLETWFRDHNSQPPSTPTGLSPVGTGDSAPELTASPFTAEHDIMSSEFQVSLSPEDWTTLLVDDHRDWINIYDDTGAPDYRPIDRNEGIDLTRLVLEEGTLEQGLTCYWRMRYRDQNLLWSEWSTPVEFEVDQLDPVAEFTADTTTQEVGQPVRFTDLSIGSPTAWEWDLDGDGSTDSDERDPVFTYTAEGDYTVTLTASINGTEYTEVKENYITIVETSVGEREPIPTDFEVGECYPNPFNPETALAIHLPRSTHVTVDVYNLVGQCVATLADARMQEGRHQVTFDGSHFSSGTYFIHVNARDYSSVTRRVVLLK